MRRLTLLVLLGMAACTEEATAPANCPNFCPGGAIDVRDTIFTDVIGRDTAFNGYLPASQGIAMAAAIIPGTLESRAVFVLNPMFTRLAPTNGDTTTVPLVPDSSRLRLTVLRHDTLATNLWLKLYAIPRTTDSSASFASLDTYFNSTPVDSVSISDLLARPLISDTATIRQWGDTIQTDSAGHVLIQADSGRVWTLFFDFDTLQAPLTPADSGQLALGIRVTADSVASLAIGTVESGGGSGNMVWYYHYTIPDTATATPDSIVNTTSIRAPKFDSFVFDPPTAPLDANLAVGGVPSARSLLRVAMPAFLHDSFDVVRATVILVPVAPLVGTSSDSIIILARPVLTDVGAKSPLSDATNVFGHVIIHPGVTDTVRIEVTDLVRSWAVDTSQAAAFFLGQSPEASSFSEIRFYSSRTPAFRPALQVTYVKRFPFGTP
ncbi:MAG: hypothetical protein ABR537_03845 [Gemmatimonadales bacterium]